MQQNDGVVIENQWTPWGRVARQSGTNPSVAQLSVLNAGPAIKKRLGLRGEPFRFRGSGDKAEFQAVGLAGTLSLKEVSIEIVPKFIGDRARLLEWNSSTLFLLEALAGKHVISLLADRQEWRSHRVVDLIAHAFADAAERGLRDQPIHVYRQVEESSTILRGRLNLFRQLRNFTRTPHILECDVDQLDVDNAYNDVLKWAAFVLARSAHEKGLKRRLEHLSDSIPGRAERSLAHRHVRLVPPPQFQAWADALELARLLAGGMTLSTTGGNRSGYSLLFNMERAFERFVEIGLASALRQIGGGTRSSNRQDSTAYAQPAFEGGKALYCRPDNVVRDSDQAVMVVDAKYKLLDDELEATPANGAASGPTSTDVYELVAGMIAHKCTAGLLVYPSSSDLSTANSAVRSWTVDAYGKQVRIGAIPIQLLRLRSRAELAQLFKELATQIAAFELAAA